MDPEPEIEVEDPNFEPEIEVEEDPDLEPEIEVEEDPDLEPEIEIEIEGPRPRPSSIDETDEYDDEEENERDDGEEEEPEEPIGQGYGSDDEDWDETSNS